MLSRWGKIALLSRVCLSSGLRNSFAIARRFEGTTTKIPKIGNIAALPSTAQSFARRIAKRRRSLAALYKNDGDKNLPEVTGVAISESIDLMGIFEDQQLSNLYQITFIDDEFEDALHLVPRDEYRINKSLKDLFVFSDGVLVAWDFEKSELNQLMDHIKEYEINSYEENLVHQEMESMPFKQGNGNKIGIRNNTIQIPECSDNNTADVLGRYAISHGMAASVKISIYENELTEYAEPLTLTTKLLMQGQIPWNRKQAMQRIGEMAGLRNTINLNCGILNADFYWEREELEKQYLQAMRYFVVEKRLRELNSRLDYCQSLANIIDNMLMHRNASRLEWMIIILIIIEVIFDLLHYFDFTATPVFLVEDPTTLPAKVVKK